MFRCNFFFDRFLKYLFSLYDRWFNKLNTVCFHSIQLVLRTLRRMWNSVYFVIKIKSFYLIRLIERIIGQLIDYQNNPWLQFLIDNIVTPLASFTVGFLAENTEQNLNLGAGLRLLIIIILIPAGSDRLYHICTCFLVLRTHSRALIFCAPTARSGDSF